MEKGLLGQRTVCNLPLGCLDRPAGGGSLKLLDSREMSVHNRTRQVSEKQRMKQRDRRKSTRIKQSALHIYALTCTWKSKYSILIDRPNHDTY